MEESLFSDLKSLERVITEVYWPLFLSQTEGKVSESLKTEFLNYIQKFSSEISQTLQQVSGEVKLNVPKVDFTLYERNKADPKLLGIIETAVEEWQTTITTVLEKEASKAPKGNGPLAEIDFWRDRHANLSTLWEQLNQPDLKALLGIWEQSDTPLLHSFRAATAELTKRHTEAKDNVKFLTTLERHFKSLSLGNLETIKEVLPSMMNALKMVWIISRYYSRDEAMTPLLERIAWQLAHKVSVVINLRTILREERGKQTIQASKEVLEKWKETYLDIRAKIEQSGSDDRWEFDKKRLFDQTDYMADRCGDLLLVSQTIEQFLNILGPELKAVTGDSHQIDHVTQRVEKMIQAVEAVGFDVFDKRYQTSWETVMTRFHETVRQIEDFTKEFIDGSFNNLRSAEGAFDLLQKLQSRESINRQMLEKFSDVLKRYSVELERTKQLFTSQKGNPPIPRNQPPVAGAISWSRLLFHKIKQPILKFRTLPELMEKDFGKAVMREYLAVAKSMKAYETEVGGTALAHLKLPILRAEWEGEGKDSKEILRVNFSGELSRLLQEAKHLEQQGWELPETAMSVTLQAEKFAGVRHALEQLLHAYHAALLRVRAEERALLGPAVAHLRGVLRVGTDSLSWNSLGISDFIDRSASEIHTFLSLVNQVQKNASMIAAVVESIASAVLLPPERLSEPRDMQEYLDLLERHNAAVTEELVRKYQTVGPLLGKIEGILENKNTLRSPRMKGYYKLWERRIFNALNRMVLVSLAALQRRMGVVGSRKGEGKKPVPLFLVNATLSAPEIAISPSTGDIHRTLSKMLKNIVESTQAFLRWMDGTCLETPPQRLLEEEEVVTFSFYADISANPQVITAMLLFNQSIGKTFLKLSKHLEVWRRYKPLWKADKGPTLEKFSAKRPSAVDFDAKLTLYSKLGRDMAAMPTEKDIQFLRLSCAPLQAAIQTETAAWLTALGKLLHSSVSTKLTELNDRFLALEADLSRSPETMEDLKFVLSVITQVRSSSVDVEREYADVEERYRTLLLHGIAAPPEEVELANSLRQKWENILLQAKKVDEALVQVKLQFTETTKKQVELFTKKVSKLSKKFHKSGPGAPDVELDYGLELVQKYQKELARFAKIREELVVAETLFNLPITTYPELHALEVELEGLGKIYTLYFDQKEAFIKWNHTLWVDLNMEELSKNIDEYFTKLKRFPAELKALPPYSKVADTLQQFKGALPLFRHLKSEALRPRHWKQLMEATGHSFQTNSKTFTLEALFQMGLHNFADKIEEITSAASKELSIETGIQKIIDTWKGMKFEVQKYVKGVEDRGYILKGIDEITTLYDDNALNLQTMSGSRFVAPFISVVHQWEKTLSLIAEVTEVWMYVQQKWMYLENIFVGSDDIRQQLPEEAKRFDRIDKTFGKLMADTAKNTLVLEACQMDRLELLKSLAGQLEMCQKSLSEYLLSKRSAFPRFFFISDDELLSIIGSQDPSSLQEHMIKLFDNVMALQFSQQSQRSLRTVVGVQSSEGEEIALRQGVAVEGQVEGWMSQVDTQIKQSLHNFAREAILQFPRKDHLDWVDAFPGMIVNLVTLIWWTWEVEEAFRSAEAGDKGALQRVRANVVERLEGLILKVRAPLSSAQRAKSHALLILLVHARDILDHLLRQSVWDPWDFEWESQLRFYWEKSRDDVRVRQTTGEFEYGWEYLGLSGRLVVTPLTARCVLTLTQALTLRLGGAPAGPAGTGKTETVKDLAKAFAVPCFVLNCSDGLDYHALGLLFAGLVQVGAWGCLDEFNRIEPEVLSVISVQIKTIQTAMRNHVAHFQLDGRDIPLDQRAGIFVTMNPGYKGRSQLPDNLKALFRPVVMVQPDLEQIAEIILVSEGFTTALSLARKLTLLYRLAKEQLSPQHHYDFGLRALKAVLLRAGALKRSVPSLSEEEVVVRALRDLNLPRCVYADVPLFEGLLIDIFPSLPPLEALENSFEKVVEEVLREAEYEVIPTQVAKVLQLNETLKTRHSAMVVGPTGGGKSVVIEALAKALTATGTPTKLYVLNPKAQPVNELYGTLDPNTREWTDGLLSSVFRECNRPTDRKDQRKYVVLDGGVDVAWVENMNSLMDDNKVLTLPNAERIHLQPHCALLFEVSDLRHASPATVSRSGMVYLDPRDLGYAPLFFKWLKSRPKGEAELLRSLWDKYVPALMDYICEGLIYGTVTQPLRTIIPMGAVGRILQLTTVLSSLLPADELIEGRVVECLFIFALVWSLGASLVEESRTLFDACLKRLSDWTLIENPEIIAGPGQLPAVLPTLFDYRFDSEHLRWLPWDSLIPGPYEIPDPPKNQFHHLFVPTKDSVRFKWMLEGALKQKTPILFVGESGTAKSLTINTFLSQLDPEKWVRLTIPFSATTSSLELQRTLEAHVERWTKGTYGPPPGKQLVVFIDDLNMPLADPYESQQPHAMLKLLIERGGFYDRGKDLNWKILRNVQFVAAMAPPGGGRQAMDPRVLALFQVVYLPPLSPESLTFTYESLLRSHWEPFHEGMQEVGRALPRLTVEVYQTVQRTLPPTPSQFHYLFTPRDISRVVEGLRLASLDKFDSPLALLRLWRHECLRVFHDRLSSDSDRAVVRHCLRDLLLHHFPEYASPALADPLLFGSFKAQEEVTVYEEYSDYATLRQYFTEQLELYQEKNTAGPPLPLVLFDDALDHLSRLLRVLTRPRGHLLLLGMSGSGKQSLARLAAFAAKCQLFEITLSRNYGDAEFREDLKQLYMQVGLENRETVFLFTEGHVAQESFLEMVNSMLSSGVVPALFSEEEKDQLVNSLRQDSPAHTADTKENYWNTFVENCRTNLHVILCMTPGERLRKRCRNYPGLLSNSVVDFYTKWPEEALTAVADHLLNEEVGIPPENRAVKRSCMFDPQAMVEHVVKVHLEVQSACGRLYEELNRHNYVTPTNFLDYLHKYIQLLKEHKKKLVEQHQRLNGGLKKLIDAAKYLDQLNVNLVEQKAIVDRKAEANNALLDRISENKAQVQTKQAMATAKERDLKELQGQILSKKTEAEAALAEALPMVEEARGALGNLSKNDVTELRSFASPHKAVQLVAQSVCILLGLKDLSWKGAKTMMAQINFLSNLMDLNPDDISDKQVRAVKELLKKLEVSPEKMESISIAGAGLLVWVLAIMKYCNVAKQVVPKRKAVEAALKHQVQNEKDLEGIKGEVLTLGEQLVALEEAYQSGVTEQQGLKSQAELMEKRLIAASSLIAGLSTERVRWTHEMEEGLALKRKRLVGDCALAAACLSYAGPFPHPYRQSLQSHWESHLRTRAVPFTDPFRVTSFLSDEVELSRWVSQGLPSDEQSAENGILTTRGTRWPLCIDPQGQARSWLLHRHGKGKSFPSFLFFLFFLFFSFFSLSLFFLFFLFFLLYFSPSLCGADCEGALTCRSAGDSDVGKQLELAVSFGLAFLLEGVEGGTEPLLDPILARQVQEVGGRKFIKLGGKEVDWNDSFRLYLTSHSSNPSFPPELYGKVQVIDYNVTEEGLEAQLLTLVVGHEQPELERRREALVMEMSENRNLLQNFEDTLLRELANSSGQMLDNAELLHTLQGSKAQALLLAARLSAAHSTAAELDRHRSAYRPVALLAARLFALLSSLSALTPMYQYSLASFLQVFQQALALAPWDPQLSTRLELLQTTLTRQVYDYTCLGLFEEHKLLFSFQLCLALLQADRALSAPLLEYFLRGNRSLEKDLTPNPLPWLSEDVWHHLHLLQRISPFESLGNHLEAHSSQWEAWVTSEAPEEEAAPWEGSAVEQLVLLRFFRPDRLYVAIRKFVTDTLGPSFVDPEVVSMTTLYGLTTAEIPVIFLLSPGADPAAEVRKVGERVGGGGGVRVKEVALGLQQGPVALSLLEAAAARGQWVLLHNCHLLPQWLPALLTLLDKLLPSAHKDFRLWLTTEPTDSFPAPLLQRSLKVVTEAPEGLQRNLQASYAKFAALSAPAALPGGAHPWGGGLVYGLAFFHAVVQLRRKYGPRGWTQPYDFNESDLFTALSVLLTYLSKALQHPEGGVPWGSLRYLIGEVIYGGRVTDPFDRRILKTYLEEYMGDFLFDSFRPFSFYKDAEVDYTLPTVGTLEGHLATIEALPATTSPAVVGLHPNAQLAYAAEASSVLLLNLSRLQVTQGLGGAGQDYSDVAKIAQDILTRVPAPFDLAVVRQDIGALPTPTETFLLQELERWNLLVTTLRTSLGQVQEALKGERGMSTDLEEILSFLRLGSIPPAWLRVAPPTTLSLSEWMEHLFAREAQYRDWLHTPPTVVWLGGLHIPAAFLTALVQQTSRAKGWALDNTSLTTQVTSFKSPEEIPKDEKVEGCYVSGLFLEGAAWNAERKCLAPQEPKKLVVDFPIIKIVPTQTHLLRVESTFRTPVYATKERTNAMGEGLVFEADLPTSKHPSHWILQGVCLLLSK